MLVHSTGLGKTVLTAEFGALEINNADDRFGLIMKIEATEPVHWYITADLCGDDIRRALKIALKPKIILKVLKLLFRKTPTAQMAAAGQDGEKSKV